MRFTTVPLIERRPSIFPCSLLLCQWHGLSYEIFATRMQSNTKLCWAPRTVCLLLDFFFLPKPESTSSQSLSECIRLHNLERSILLLFFHSYFINWKWSSIVSPRRLFWGLPIGHVAIFLSCHGNSRKGWLWLLISKMEAPRGQGALYILSTDGSQASGAAPGTWKGPREYLLNSTGCSLSENMCQLVVGWPH